jgi:hypothetical protein
MLYAVCTLIHPSACPPLSSVFCVSVCTVHCATNRNKGTREMGWSRVLAVCSMQYVCMQVRCSERCRCSCRCRSRCKRAVVPNQEPLVARSTRQLWDVRREEALRRCVCRSRSSGACSQQPARCCPRASASCTLQATPRLHSSLD